MACKIKQELEVKVWEFTKILEKSYVETFNLIVTEGVKELERKMKICPSQLGSLKMGDAIKEQSISKISLF